MNKLDESRVQQLIRRLNNAEDFKYDDEAEELNEILKVHGMAWKWAGEMFNERVLVYYTEEKK